MNLEQQPAQEQTLKQMLLQYLAIVVGFVLIVLGTAFILFEVGRTIFQTNRPFPTSLIHQQK